MEKEELLRGFKNPFDIVLNDGMVGFKGVRVIV
jgi:hypothetical protein